MDELTQVKTDLAKPVRRNPGLGVPASPAVGGRPVRWLGLLLGALVCGAAPAWGLELCSLEANALMRDAGVSEAQIARVCALAAQSRSRLTLALAQAQDGMGYCRVRLKLDNLGTEALDSLVLTVEQARFEPFRFTNIPPGGTGYASSTSRILLACDELPTVRLVFHWPPSVRMAGRVLSGRQLLYYRPQLLDAALAWSR